MAISGTPPVGTVLEGHPEPRKAHTMHPEKRKLLWINALGGSAVLASYILSINAHSGAGSDFWGSVPAAIQPVYVISMLLAALGYFAFTGFVLRLNPGRVRIFRRYGYGLFKAIYALILVPSALWMPLTLAMIEQPSSGLWVSIRLTLAAVGLGALILLAAVLGMKPSDRPSAWRMAVAGSVAFFFQTGILDALVWPAFFPA